MLHVADINRQDAAGVIAGGFEVDVGIVLAGVADENEGQVGVSGQDFIDHVCFVGLVIGNGIFGGKAEVAQQDGAAGEVVEVQEVEQQIVKVPRGVGDVEEGVEAFAIRAEGKRLVKVGDTREGMAFTSVF